MRASRLLPLLVALALPLAACGSEDTDVVTTGAATATTDVSDGTTSSGSGVDDAAAYDCREIDGVEVCDTFGESDEGPGTATEPAGGTDANAASAPAAPTARQAPATSVPEGGEPYEGPGTERDPDAGATHACRQVEGREVCDTFGESDEGPGTYTDREGPGTEG